MTSPNAPVEVDPGETAHYISRLAREMRQLAAKANLSFLAYLLAMVEDEAENAARQRSERRHGA